MGELFEEMGRFDEDFAPAYYEETDYCMRLWRGGHRVLYEPDAVVLHFEFGSAAVREDAIGLQRKNQALFFEKHQDRLARQHPPDLQNVLAARSRDATRPRRAP